MSSPLILGVRAHRRVQEIPGGLTMKEFLDKKFKITRIALNELKNSPMIWTQLTKVVVKESPSPWNAQVIIRWMLENGYMESPQRGVYRITEKGQSLLMSLK